MAAWNARAEFSENELTFDYFENYVPWLPLTYDQSESWNVFQVYLAAACFFWSLRDWLLTKSKRELFGPRDGDVFSRTSAALPFRMRKLLWVLCINGAILALEGSIQRLSGTNELLWLVRPRYSSWAHAQFGPFHYRSNAAQYLNMLWPLGDCLWVAPLQVWTKKVWSGD